MREEESRLVVQLAQEFIDCLRRHSQEWQRGFFRFSLEESKRGSNASFEHVNGVDLISSLKNANFYTSMNELGGQLIKLLEKTRGAFILIVNSDSGYTIDFDFENLERWKISKLNGGTGIPEGI